ncbi:MAG: type II secretion system protein GspD, partial [Candidatus Aminicenantia bacterium]
ILIISCGPKVEKIETKPAEIKKEEIPPVDLTITKTEEIKKEAPAEEEKRQIVKVKDVDIKDLLIALTTDTEISLIIDPDVKGIVPILDVKDITLGKLLNYTLPQLGLCYSWDGKILRVFKARLETRVFYLNYIAVSREGERNVSYSTRSTVGGGGGIGGIGGVTGAGGMVGGGGMVGAMGAGGAEAQSTTNIKTKTETNIWNDLIAGLEAIIFGKSTATTERTKAPSPYSSSDEEGRRLIISPQTGIIMITDYPEKLNQAAHFIESLEGSSQRQVWIEAKILEVILDQKHQMGVNWDAVLNPGEKFFGLLPSTDTVMYPSTSLDTRTPLSQDLSASYGSFQYGVSNNKIDFILDALSRQGQLKVLLSPRLSALNNEKAVIRVVREEAFFNLYTLTTVAQAGAVTAPSINLQIVPVGIMMDIIPQISANGEITLSINPDISELVEIRTFQSQGAMATQPVIDRRSIDTVAKVKDGQTIIIAGIIKERKKEELRGAPFIMKIPFVGSLFRRTEQSLERSELVILITPTLMVGKKIQELSDEERKRVEEAVKPFHFGDIEPWDEGIKGELKKKRDD